MGSLYLDFCVAWPVARDGNPAMSNIGFAVDLPFSANGVPSPQALEAVRAAGFNFVVWHSNLRANAAGAPAAFGWSPPAPDAVLRDANGAVVGKYYPGPTWEHNDGSKVTGKQLAVSPVATGIALQLVQANPATGNGLLNGVTYIQRVNTVGGSPMGSCSDANVGAKQVVKYEADCYFYKAA